MPPHPSDPELFDLALADDPRDIVHRAVACLAQGGLAILPTETSYALVASALQPGAVDRLLQARPLSPQRGLSLAIRSPEELSDYAPSLPRFAIRLARRCWPGPLTILVPLDPEPSLVSTLPEPVRHAVTASGWLGLKLPRHLFLRHVQHLCPGPLVLSSLRHEGDRIRSLEALPAVPPGVQMIVDDGPLDASQDASVVRILPERWELVRQGAISAEALTHSCGTILLFVCTGNTCRSPMAEALCRTILAERLGCTPEEVAARGIVVVSAGVSAIDGIPAAAHAADVVRQRGGSLASHVSRRVTPTLVRHADVIVAMTGDHRDVLLDHFPEAADRLRLLHPWGEDVEDPIGTDRENYRQTAREIEQYLQALLDELGY